MRKITLPVSTPKKTLSGDLLKKTVRKALAADTLQTFDAADRPGQIPAGAETDAGTNGKSSRLTPAQQKDADVVAKLSPDFPKQSWDSMSYKAQLQAMKFSELTEQEQWQLLNPSAPLSVLDAANRERYRPIPTTGADKDPEILTNPSKTPYLQNAESDGQLGKDGPVGPVATPKPGVTPQATPNPERHQKDISDNEALVPQLVSGLVEALKTIDSDYLSSVGKYMLTLAMKRAASGNLTAKDFEILCRTYTGLKREENKYLALAPVVTSSMPGASWDATLINDQDVYSDLPGTFGRYGTLKKNGCGFIAINNVNQLLGDKTNFSDTYYELNSQKGAATLLWGIMGMNPEIVRAYYEFKGYEVTICGLEEVPAKHDAYIMLYAYFKQLGAHYIAISYNEQTGLYTAYNNKKGSSNTDTETEFIGFLPKNAFFDCVWGIDK